MVDTLESFCGSGSLSSEVQLLTLLCLTFDEKFGNYIHLLQPSKSSNLSLKRFEKCFKEGKQNCFHLDVTHLKGIGSQYHGELLKDGSP